MGKRTSVLTALVVALTVAPADAQYFGRNKVQYETFDFQILETPHFEIYYYPDEQQAAREAARLAERWYTRLSRALDHTLRERQPIVLYASHTHFTQTTVVDGFLREGTGGLTDHFKGRVVLPFGVGLGETDHVLGHELVHVFQRDVLRRMGRSMSALPLWFLEGMAEHLSIDGIDPNTAMWLRDAVEQQRLPRIDQLDDPRWFPYRYGQALWAFLAHRYGDNVAARALRTKASGGALGRLMAVTNADIKTLSGAWHDFIRETTSSVGPVVETPARQETPVELMEKALAEPRAIVNAGRGGGRINVGPAISPDGSELIFLSERDRYSVEVFLADARTGAIVRKLIETSIDPHFESLQFIESAGAWDPAGRRFAFSAISGGQPVLTVIDAHTGAVEREIRLDVLDQIFSPTWSPDGQHLAFSGMKGGYTDLYVVDLLSLSLRNLTRDEFSDLQPAWSPDGRTIAFSTDRFSSSLATLHFGEYRLGLYDIASDAIHELPSVSGGKSINPQWSANGSGLYFIADEGSISNVHRLDLASGGITRITDVTTGVSGITELSPALSVARASDVIVFCVYRRGGYEIQTARTPQDQPLLTASSLPVSTESVVVTPALAEKSGRQTEPRANLPAIADAAAAASLDGSDFAVKPYNRAMSFSGIAQPYLTAGGGGTGGFLRGGVALSFSDMLGDQELRTIVQVGKSMNDFALHTAYVSRRSRWNWGVIGSQTPWFSSGGSRPLVVANDGSNTLFRQSSLFRHTHRQVAGLTVYPLSQARRLELTMGGQVISYDRISTDSTYSSANGQLLTQSKSTAGAAPDALLAETRAAFVSDTTIFGPTSPIRGERYRLALASTLGSLRFATVTADYRKYTMPARPVTIAARLMHVGRYGPDAADPRLLPLVFTLRDVVRGYGDLGPPSSNLLLANKLWVANVEGRVPLLPFFGKVARNTPIPVEGFLFSDIGAFETRSSADMSSRATTRLSNVGAGARLSAAGLIFEFAGVRPLGSYAPGWRLAFNVRPGF